ncbi:MAG: hypothetical protein NXI03_09885, partial [Alphaproteobacteria bacterium]|nr:hypothetical protein [Alphaproteobacteria bacterium]
HREITTTARENRSIPQLTGTRPHGSTPWATAISTISKTQKISFIDTVGAKAFVARAKELEAKFGDQFAVPGLLEEMASKGETFYGRFGTQAAAA